MSRIQRHPIMTIEECVKAHNRDLKIIQVVSIILVIIFFMAGIYTGILFMR